MYEEQQVKSSWNALLNPFNVLDTPAAITGHVSGRSTDIAQIISGGQSAIVLAGAPKIGKTALIRYLQLPSDSDWSWRNELADFPNQQKLKHTHFVQVDLTRLEGIESKEELLAAFVKRCTLALQSAYYEEGRKGPDELNLRGLIKLLRDISQVTPYARYFLMLDTIERLGRFGIQSFKPESKAQTPQERGLALLDHCNAIRTLVDLIDEFRILGFILSIESLPRAKVADQFTHVSADLARFKTMTLQTFTWQDAAKFLAQEPESFGDEWARGFNELNKSNCIFSEREQKWLREQAGTHPYLLQQFCFYAFYLKQEYAKLYGTWIELQESGKRQIIDWINEGLSTFLTRTWDRLEEAFKSNAETKEKTLADFREFIQLLTQKQDDDQIKLAYWDQWGSELRYVLCSEGVLRYDPFQTIHFPGTILRRYLAQKTRENAELFTASPVPPTTGRGFWLSITHSDKEQELLSLSDLEYRLLKTLLQNPRRCTELELMLGAWGKKTDKAAFTQRMHHLRKKLREECGTEIIENRYGGMYSLNHPEWFHLD